jgi:hypothetical protein
MGMFKKDKEIGGTKEILKYAGHFVAIPYNVKKNNAKAVTENGVKVMKAGTILPADDATAVGVVLNDIVIEYAGDKGIAVPLVVHGFIDGTKVTRSDKAEAALTQIKFIGGTATKGQ